MALGWKKEYLRYKAFFLNIQNNYRGRDDIKMFLEVLLSLTAISVFGVFALRPTILTIAGLHREIKTKKETLTLMESKIVNLRSAQKILNEQSAILPILETAVPLNPKPEEFTHQIQGLANKNSVKMSGVSIEKITLKGASPFVEGAGAMNFSGGVVGDYVSLLSLLYDLENLRMPLAISSISLSTSKNKEEASLDLTISGSVPYLNEKN